MFRVLRAATIACIALAIGSRTAVARVVRVDITSRTDIEGGSPFGAGGPYERIVGRVYFVFDPRNPHDRQIVDLSLAPRNSSGEVEAWSDFVILRPKDPSRSANLALIDIANRGSATTGVFNLGANRGASPDSAPYYGDAFLLRRGITVVMIGWQWDAPTDASLLHFHAPRAGSTSQPITGLVRADVTVDAATATIGLGHRVGASQARAYPVADPNDSANTLTVRDGPLARRTVLPRSTWHFGPIADGQLVSDSTSVVLDGGFQPGKIYEVIYRAKEPLVVAAGMAAVRDIMSYIKYDPSAITRARYGVAYGVSQTGRFIRHFLYQDFNTDESGRQVFDGFFAHTAGAGRGSFNHRFAQPSRDAQPYTTFFYPTDVFPFTSAEEIDPVTNARGGLRSMVGRIRYETALPKVFYVDGGYEYWGRAASLTHTTLDARQDVSFLPSERRYVISSAQHSSPSAFPPRLEIPGVGPMHAYRGDPLDQRLALRALFVDLVDWVRNGVTPPASQYPTLASRTLVPPLSVAFPVLPGVRVARIPYQPYRYDFGSHWKQGIVDNEPPKIGAPYPILVAQVDSIGNDLGGIRSVEVQVPLGTYFPWQLRTGMPAAEDRMLSFAGTFVPLARTEQERRATGDSRPSVERLYASRATFMEKVDAAARSLVVQRFMLPDDVAAARDRMAATWDWIAARP